MKKLNQQGIVDSWLVAFIVTLVVFLGAAVFGGWAYMGRQDYKNNVDAKIATAVAAAEEANSAKKEKEFTEREKEPLRTYTGPSAYGSISISYPKTWSAYIDENGRGSAPLDGYLNPNFVPGLQSDSSVSLRIQVLNSAYSQNIRSYEQAVKTGKVRSSVYAAPKVANIVGVRLDGEIKPKKQGSMIVLPLRDKTLQVWAESDAAIADFNNIILPNLTFIP